MYYSRQCNCYNVGIHLADSDVAHMNMYYSRQCNCYNFGIHLADSDVAFMNVRHEAMALPGAAIKLLLAFLTLLPREKQIDCWSYIYCGQNKNRTLIFLMVYMTNLRLFLEAQQKFVLKDYSFLNCDRDLVYIERCKAKKQCLTTDNVMEVIHDARDVHHVIPIKMQPHNFLDFVSACDGLINRK
ncbi:hypothetical protein PR048_027387 [Dryococelus australis]|uniref:Uncharacterized protein n=1 Tax=Dryococelus australis TaxID=614101 RepID=A0ABQ9GFH6_9NEOP|nr:hypothetical protein PR048_027387 [Dryococelus australis]